MDLENINSLPVREVYADWGETVREWRADSLGCEAGECEWVQMGGGVGKNILWSK